MATIGTYSIRCIQGGAKVYRQLERNSLTNYKPAPYFLLHLTILTAAK